VTVQVGTADRLRRLLAILAWLAQEGEAPIDVVAARFDLSPDALVTELEMAACCGVPPYTPDQLMEIVVTDTTVSTRMGVALARPRRLSPAEGLTLATSARALLAVPGSDERGALSRALAKLDRALGALEVDVELDAPPLLALVRSAVDSHRSLAVTYYSASTDRVSERRITPIRLFSSEGHWYVDAWCDTADGVRRFRVDRISAAAEVDSPPAGTPERGGSAAPDAASTLAPYVPGPDANRVRLSLDPATAWLVESVPSSGPPEPVGDRVEVEVYVGGDAWLERLLLRLGPDARVMAPSEYQDLAATAAARVLRRYQSEV
jgi:proteasome accessory factor C